MPQRPRCQFLLFGLLAALLPAPSLHAQSHSVHLNAEIGIGGRYRPGGWIPITINVVNGSADTVQGQIQIAPMDTGSIQNNAATFARPVNLLPSTTPQDVQIDERGLDPGSQDVAVSLVDGAARGDGAMEAQITTNDSQSHNTFTGLPIAADDLFLVGLSADPTVITRLTGQQWGLRHTAGGVTSAFSLSRAAWVSHHNDRSSHGTSCCRFACRSARPPCGIRWRRRRGAVAGCPSRCADRGAD
jgi:hypothetical protein